MTLLSIAQTLTSVGAGSTCEFFDIEATEASGGSFTISATCLTSVGNTNTVNHFNISEFGLSLGESAY
jgi:hypothetical protein